MAENGYAKPVLVTTGWVAEHLGDENVVLAEVDENPDLYDEGHITGAVKLHWRQDLQDPIERDLIVRGLEVTNGNVTRTAKLLKISRKSLQMKMKEFGLRDKES